MKKKNKYLIGIIAIIVIIAGALIISADAGSSKVQVAGSTSVQPVAEKLVEVYKESHPDAQINVQGGGSSVGIKSVEDGSADIGMCSKALDNNSSLQQYELGKDGIVIAINTQNQVSDLSDEQLQGIFSGKITVITREEGSGTLDAFESIVMGDSKIKDDAVVQSSTEAVKQSVSQDPNAIGFVSYAHMSDDIKAVNVNGVAPSDATIADGTYELQRPFLFLTNGEPTGETKNFIDWVLSDDGGKVLADEKIIKTSK